MDRQLLTPFFLEQGSPGHLGLRTPGMWVNQPTFFSSGTSGRLNAIHSPLAQAVHTTLQAGQRPVSIAGDCCAVIPVIAGLQRHGLSPRLMWLDAHGDFNTRETSPSGFVGGMPLAMLVGRGERGLMAHVGAQPLAERDVVLVNARNLDPLERVALAASQVVHVPDLGGLANLALDDRPLHVHLDVDILDPSDCPAVHYPSPGGPRTAELALVMRQVVAKARPASVSVTTWIVDQDADGRSQKASLEVLAAILGTA